MQPLCNNPWQFITTAPSNYAYAHREENQQQLLTAASDDESWPKAKQFLFLKQTQQNYITLLLDKSLAVTAA